MEIMPGAYQQLDMVDHALFVYIEVAKLAASSNLAQIRGR
jgi:hypothetical protein